MKKKEFNELKNKSVEDLIKMVSVKKAEAGKKVMEAFSGKEKNLKLSSALRRDVAQIKTLIKEKQILNLIQSVRGSKKGK